MTVAEEQTAPQGCCEQPADWGKKGGGGGGGRGGSRKGAGTGTFLAVEASSAGPSSVEEGKSVLARFEIGGGGDGEDEGDD